ncbi:HNH endonuclease signature motif containing protein [Gryllotalpicola daejeonensis]|uniref:HNH endonuclease signature motif containing protein n=1 Tax=Gryllotalpicola daejeonensis TaxID=993087 RepID=A0ABP7ZIS5_9MICO
MSKVGSAACGALARLAGVLPVDPAVLTDGQLVRFVEQVEEAGRQIDALRLAAAAAVQERSEDGAPDSLARRLGFKTAAGAIQGLTKSSGKEAQKLVAQATELKKLPAVEAAVLDGRIGREAAAAISSELTKAAGKDLGRADAVQVAQVEAELVELAVTAGADEVKAKAAEKAALLDVRVVEDTAAKAMAERFFAVGPTIDGAAKVSGLLPAGHAAVIRGVFDAFINPKGKKTVTFTPADEQLPSDGRTAGQKRADLFRDICAAQARSAEVPEMGGDHPTVWISTTVKELQSGEGLAFYAGTPEPVPVAEAEQAACAGGIQTVIFGDDGQVLRLGRSVRGFTRRQRRAIALRDGGTCLIPGCTVPAQWCEVHHVISFKDGGNTDLDNGVLLCWFHHHEIDTGPWHIRMINGTPEVRYTHGGRVIDWTTAGDGTAARLKQHAGAPPGVPPGAPPGTPPGAPEPRGE